MSNDHPSILRPAPSRWDHWRDYAAILRHGVVARADRIDGRLVVERSGPFVPAISFPSSANVVLTEQSKVALAQAVPQLEFRQVILGKAVLLDWQEWPADAEEPAQYPSSGEPEDYLSEHPHDPALADRIGPLWELVPTINAEIQGRNGCLRIERWQHGHLVRADLRAGYNFVSPALRAALSSVAPDCVTFVPSRPCD